MSCLEIGICCKNAGVVVSLSSILAMQISSRYRGAILDTVAQGTSTSLFQWFLSEHILSGVTFLGHSLVLLGFLYLSYDLLGKPRGILKGLLILFTHFVVSILVLAIFAPAMLFLFQQTLRATHLPPHIVDL